MTYPFKEIIIIYNPNSTGDSKTNAKQLAEQVRGALPSVKVSLFETTHRGHAEELGAQYAKDNASVLLISSSGDGGYNELINGVMDHENTNVATCVLPSGNANDHYHATTDDSLVDRIVSGKVRYMDVLKIRGKQTGKTWQRYAHSYIGIGLTAYIGEKLTEADLNPLREKWLVIKYLLKFGHVTLRLDGDDSWHRYASVVVANINRMSKYVQLSNATETDDGEAELYALRSSSFIQLVKYFLMSATVGLKATRRKSTFEYVAKGNHAVQCDGEVFRLDGGVTTTISVNAHVLRTL